jgi:2-keto-4-pentenoate hydratase/2-oxohepta-3-ene-1,7-dioic acid hydratase in catechol pathway
MGSLVTYRLPGDASPRAGILAEDGTVRTTPEIEHAAGAIELLTNWQDVAGTLRGLDGANGTPVPDAIVDAPLLYPRKLICAGANYLDHLAEMGDGAPPEGVQPFFFLLPPTTSIVGDGAPILLPGDPTVRADYEAELAVVIGREGRDIAPEDARDYVAGYTIFNDITARGRLARPVSIAAPFAFDWLSAKGPDTFGPMGPGIVPDWFIDDPRSLGVRLWLNGELKQDGDTSQMIFDVWDLVAAASRTVTLEPGDVIATGTPAGVGVAQNLQLKAGDELVVEIDGIGRLTNPVVARESAVKTGEAQ